MFAPALPDAVVPVADDGCLVWSLGCSSSTLEGSLRRRVRFSDTLQARHETRTDEPEVSGFSLRKSIEKWDCERTDEAWPVKAEAFSDVGEEEGETPSRGTKRTCQDSHESICVEPRHPQQVTIPHSVAPVASFS